MIDLSILIPSTNTRFSTYLPKIKEQLYAEYDQLTEEEKNRVEILFLVDNKTMMLGHKRNVMVDIAQGKYVVHVDDDDRIATDYIKSLLEATKEDKDVIVFQAEVSINGAPPKICYYSKDNLKDFNNPDAYYRIPNHICCVKKEIAIQSSFPNTMYGEDAGYSKVLLQHLKSETKIDKVLYYYDYNRETSETQVYKPNKLRMRRNKPIVDVIFLSKADTPEKYEMTKQAVDTCVRGANGLRVNPIIVEQTDKTYDHKTLFKPGKFNYNEFANHGASKGSAEWIMIANNDLIFEDGWLHNLIGAGADVVSPHEPTDHRQAGLTENTYGFENGTHFSGWCFMIKRSIWEQIGGFDSEVDFWCSDDVVIEQVKAKGYTPLLVKNSIVKHLGSKSFQDVESKESQDLRWRNVYIFNQKYNKSKFKYNRGYKAWLRANSLK